MSKKYEYLFLASNLEYLDEQDFDKDVDAIEHARQLSIERNSWVCACKVVADFDKGVERNAIEITSNLAGQPPTAPGCLSHAK